MALEPGGYADKLGNRYEGRWVVRQLLRVLEERLQSVTCEAVGNDEQGVDLWIEHPNGVRQDQQCKLRNVSKNDWSIADLNQRGILASMKRHLDRGPTNQFALVTALPSILIHDLCESARNSSGDPEEFFSYQIEALGDDRRRGFRQFCERLDLNSESQDDRAKAFSYLQRLFIENWPDTNANREDLCSQTAMLVRGDPGKPSTVVAVLADFAQNNLRKRLDATTIWKHLESNGFYPRKLPNDTRISTNIQKLQTQFADSISNDLIAGKLIDRDETKKILESLKQNDVIVLHGSPGQGKSGVLYGLTEEFKTQDIAYLPLRLDRQEPEKSARQYGTVLDLPESPVMCLEAIAGDRPAVLILDQLDAIRWTSRHSLGALEVCKELVREIRGLRAIGKQASVVLACRTYDMQNDPEIKNWLQSERHRGNGRVEIAVEPLSVDTVTKVVELLRQNPGQMSERQRSILQSPQHLAMWARIAQELGAFEFQSRVQLMRGYWASRMREMTQRGFSESDANRVLTSLVQHMEQKGCVSAPRSIIADTTILDALCACGLVRASDGQVTFSHQSYLDYQIASRVVREIFTNNQDICAWLGPRDRQSLHRREPLRQALCLLSDESADSYLETIKTILTSGDVRFHLKHLCLEVMGQLDVPPNSIIAYLKELVIADDWKEHIFGTVFLGHAPFVKLLIEDGTISKWLEDEKWQNYALWILRNITGVMPDKVVEVLAPYANRDDEWKKRVLGCLPWSPKDDSDSMFELRLELARQGVFQEYVNWEELAGRQALLLLESVVSYWDPEDMPQNRIDRSKHRKARIENWTDRDLSALLLAARDMPRQAWAMLIPHISRLAPQSIEQEYALELWLDDDYDKLRQGREYVLHGLMRLAIESGRYLAKEDGSAFWRDTEALRSHNSPAIQYLMVEVYANLPSDIADEALEWLVDNNILLSIGTGENEPKWKPAARFIEALSPLCSMELFHRLEEAIIHYHSPDEYRDAEYHLSYWKRGHCRDYWGRAQYFLLPALCAERRCKETTGLIGVLERKYAGYSADMFIRRYNTGGLVGSRLPSDSLDHISDKAWLGIIQSERVSEERHSVRRRWLNGHCEDASVEMFSNDMQRMAKRFPERFGKLGLRFPDNAHPRYMAAVIDGLQQTEPKEVLDEEKAAWKPASVALIEQVLAKFGGRQDRTYVSSFCWLLYYRAEERWSEATYRQLVEYACHHPDPKEGKLYVGNKSGNFNSDEATVHTLENNAINCIRGVAALAIGQHLWKHSDLFDQFRSAITQLCKDSHPAVRVAAMRACLPALNVDRDFAIECFCDATADDLRVAASREGVYYFNTGMQSYREQLTHLVIRMLAAPQADVVEQGAEEVAARWLFHNYLTKELEECLHGSVPQRKGLAKVAASFVNTPEYFDRCSRIIEQFKNDPEKEVRDLLRLMVRSPEILKLPEGVTLVQSFIDSQAFRDDPTGLVYGLEEYAGSLLPFSDVLFAMCDQFVGPLRDASRDSSFGILHDVKQFMPILIRLHEQAEEIDNIQIVGRCLDAWDAMFERRVGVVHELAQAIG